MEGKSPEFSLDVLGVKGFCPVGETYANRQVEEAKIPVLSCEGPCVRGEIARRAANLVAKEVPNLARACHGETLFVPHSAMAAWVKGADQAIMIDGCFLRCHGRALSGVVGEGKLVQIDANRLHRKYGDVFSMDDVPEQELAAVARQVANQIIATLRTSAEIAVAKSAG